MLSKKVKEAEVGQSFLRRLLKHKLVLFGIVSVLALLLIVLGPIYYTILYPERTQKVASDQSTQRKIIAELPADGVYSADAGIGGSYKDPIHGFFQVEPPKSFTIEENRNNTTARLDNGEVIPCSRIHFLAGKTKIGVSARKTLHNVIDDDLEVVLRQYRLAGMEIKRTRFIIIDAVRGVEILVKVADYYFLLVKYKKHSLDHSIIVTCYPAHDFPRFFKQEFLSFLRSYRSIEPK